MIIGVIEGLYTGSIEVLKGYVGYMGIRVVGFAEVGRRLACLKESLYSSDPKPSGLGFGPQAPNAPKADHHSGFFYCPPTLSEPFFHCLRDTPTSC